MDTNENRNGVVRKILPKGSPFDAILDEEMRRIDRMLNDRPLKRLDWRTPSRAGLAFGAHQAKPSAEAHFTGLTETAILPTNHKKVLA